MDARTVLVVDPDPRGAAILELGLQRAGYLVSVVNSADEAIVRLEEEVVDLVICDTVLAGYERGDTDGFALVSVLRAHPRLSVPVIILSSSSAVADKVRGLDLGAEDYLCKPLSVNELLARVRVLFARRAQHAITTATRAQLAGSTDDLSVVDLVQTFEVASKSGTLRLRNGDLEAVLTFRHGALVDARQGKLTGQEAAFRAILWGESAFEIVFKAPDNVEPKESTIGMSTAAVILEGLRRADDWGRLLRDLPPLGAHLSVREDELLDRLADIPDEVDGIIKLLDGSRTLLGVIDDSPFDDVSSLETLVKLAESGLLDVVNEPDIQPMSLSSRVLIHDEDPSSNWLVPLPSTGDKPPTSSGAVSFTVSGQGFAPESSGRAPVPVGKIALRRDEARIDESAPRTNRHDPRAEPQTPLPQPSPAARVDVTMPSALAPDGLRDPAVKGPLSWPSAASEAHRYRLRIAVFAVLALTAGFALVALARGCSNRVKANETRRTPAALTSAL